MKKVFLDCQTNGIKFFPVVLVRTNMILGVMDEADTNKILQGNSIELCWYDHEQFKFEIDEVPLRQMICQRAKYSIHQQGLPEVSDEWSHLFGGWNHTKSSLKYMLDKTLYRPRDLICYLNLIKKKHGKKRAISRGMVDSVFSDFSDYMVKEWRNELCAHQTTQQVDEIFRVLKIFKDTEFTFTDLVQKVEGCDKKLAEEIMKTCYRFGLACILYKNSEGKKDVQWSHRPGSGSYGDFDLDCSMSIHFTLKEFFNRKKSGWFS